MKNILRRLLVAVFVITFVACGNKSGNDVIVVHPHEEYLETSGKGFRSVFLAGTIDMGASIDWQSQAVEMIRNLEGQWMLYNPRCEHWDPSVEGAMDYQVEWELSHLEKADWIVMNLLPDSKSPISLLELGIHARSGKLLVICTPEFYRYDNVRITCSLYGIPLYNTLAEAIAKLK